MKIKLHFNRNNMRQHDPRVWSAHTSKACNMAEEVEIYHGDILVGKAVFHADKKNNPRAWVEFHGEVQAVDGKTRIVI